MNSKLKRKVIDVYQNRFISKIRLTTKDISETTLIGYSYYEIIKSINNEKFIVIHMLNKNYSGFYIEKVKYYYR
jgi:predicted nucleic-acid-binding Zn-ribbon protein